MKQRLLSLFIALLGITAGTQAASVTINATNFPDANFRNWILTKTYGKDGILTDEEIASVTEIAVYQKNISNLKGIEFFSALTKLYCDLNQLTVLDVSKNTALIRLDCWNNQLTSLDVSKNTALEELNCYNNQLTTLDVSKNTALRSLSCHDNQLTTLDISRNTELVGLLCSYNQLTTLDVSKNTALINLYCYDNQLTALDVSKNTALQVLDCYDNQLTTLDISKNTALTYLSCGGNQLTTLDVSKNTALEWLYCQDNRIRGEGMQKLVDGLYDRSATWTGELHVYEDNGTADGNEMTTLQVEAAKAKNWKVLMFDDDSRDWVDYPGVASAASITLNKSEAIVRKNKTVTLKVTVSSEIEDKSVKWKSSDKSIATVSSDGKVKGIKSGVVTITCTSNATGEKATCKVTVGTITLNKKEVIVRKKKSVTLKPTVYPTTLEDKSVKWKSSDKTIATVSSSGKVTGVKSGVVTITCTSNATGLSTTCKVTVGTITLNKSEVIVRKKKTVTLTPTVYPTTLEDKSVTWKSSDESVATVSSDGVVTGIKSGVITITCTSNATGLSTTCKVTVATIALNKSSATITVGNTLTLKPTVYPTTLEDQSVTWKSSNKSVATVKNGKVTGVAAGTATITCTSVATGVSTTCKVTVKAASARTLDGDDEELTDIEIVEMTPAVEEPFDVYDLRGHQVLHQVTSLDALPAGVYIVKGKKVMKK